MRGPSEAPASAEAERADTIPAPAPASGPLHTYRVLETVEREVMRFEALDDDDASSVALNNLPEREPSGARRIYRLERVS